SEKEPLDYDATHKAFAALQKEMKDKHGVSMTIDEIAYGFIKVANEAMCRPIRALTQAKGHDTSKHTLASFGGAGGQHACAIARSLGIKKVLIHKYSSVLSAYGLSLADVVHEVQEPMQDSFDLENLDDVKTRFESMETACKAHLAAQGFPESHVVIEQYLNLRYQGTDTSMMTLRPLDGSWNFAKEFVANHRQEFGFTLPDRPMIIDDVRVRAIGKATWSNLSNQDSLAHIRDFEKRLSNKKDLKLVSAKEAESMESVYWGDSSGTGRRRETPLFLLEKLKPGDHVQGPALLVDKTFNIALEPGCIALVTDEHVAIWILEEDKTENAPKNLPTFALEHVDPIMLSVFAHRFMSIAEQMGRTLQKTSISTNIKERLDFSCALFGPDGGL
ncbi:hypothetical protein HDV05_002657, partial [Chytridiales sp. JEL 0842]